jgi:hypothetical protein
MPQSIFTQHEMPGLVGSGRSRATQAIVIGAATLGAAIGLASAVLWFHYGTAVFFEMIASGISACF